MMDVVISEGHKVKLKVKRNDDPKKLASSFAKIYGLNSKSEKTLRRIIAEHMKRELQN